MKSNSHDEKHRPKKEEGEEVMFEIIGHYGPWQRDIFIILFFLKIIEAYQSLAITFLAPNIDYWCVSNLGDTNFSDISSTLNSSDGLHQKRSQCNIIFHFESNSNDTDSKTIPCQRWEYSTSFYSQTIVNEWDLVCEREWLVSLAKSIYMVGFMASVLVFGQFADSFGRFPAILVCWAITCFSGILSAFSNSYLMFGILRFLMAFGSAGLTTVGFVLMMEIVGPKWRTEFGFAMELGWSIGVITMPAIAWFVRHWIHLQLVLNIPTVVFVCIYWIIPESPRWLMTQRKRKQFEEVIENAVRKNRRELKDDVKNILVFPAVEMIENKPRNMTLLDLIRTPRMRKRTINMVCVWIVNAYVFYSLSYNTNDLGGDPYLNVFLSGLIEFPAFATFWMMNKKWGRKFPTLALMVICGVAYAAMIPVPKDVYWLGIFISLIGKFCVTVTFGILNLYTMEMFPTVVRNLAVGACSTFARVGSIVAPFVHELGKATNSWAPNAVNAILVISTAFLLLFLPETKNRKIPDTLQEGEEFGCNVHVEEHNE